MPVNVAAVRDRVQRLLVKMLGRVEVDSDGDFTFPYESTRVYIRVGAFGDIATIVSVFAITNFGLKPTPELFEFIALNTDQFIFGHLGCAEQQDGTVNVLFRETLLGDVLDPQELRMAIQAVATSANEVDDKIRSQFGGQVMGEAPAQ